MVLNLPKVDQKYGTWKVLECGAGEERRSVGSIV